MSDAGVPGRRARDGAEARRVQRPDHAEREALRAHRGGLRRAARSAKLTPEQQRLAWLVLHELRARRRASSTRPRRSGCREINQRLAALYTELQPERARRRERLRARAREGGRPRRPARLACAPARPRPPRRAARRASGRSPTRARRSSRSSPTPTAATCARRSGACSSTAATTATRTTTTRSSPRSCKLRAERAKLLGYPTHAHWRLENAMAKTPERAMELMEAVWTPAVARVREEVADMQAIADTGRREASRSSRGTTATTRRRCARRSTTSTRTR